MSSFIREGGDPSNRARFQHLRDRLFGICEQLGLKHTEAADGSLIAFWPWGDDALPVCVGTSALEAGTPRGDFRLSLLTLGVPCVVPKRLLDESLAEMATVCARYGVCVSVGDNCADSDLQWPSHDLTLSVVIPQRSLSVASVEDAILLLGAAQFELGGFCRQFEVGHGT
jgi:hypothetical protein